MKLLLGRITRGIFIAKRSMSWLEIVSFLDFLKHHPLFFHFFLLSFFTLLFSCQIYLHLQDSPLAPFCHRLRTSKLVSSVKYSLQSSTSVCIFLLYDCIWVSCRQRKPDVSKIEFSLLSTNLNCYSSLIPVRYPCRYPL